MKRSPKDLLFVGIQLVLFVWYAFPLISQSWDMGKPGFASGILLSLVGIAVILIAFFNLNTNLSPFPSPKSSGVLIQSGLYRYVRHPIYTGIFVGGIGWGLLSENATRLLITSLLLILFYFKATYEEGLLQQRYEAYAEYRKRTGMFFPRFFLSKENGSILPNHKEGDKFE